MSKLDIDLQKATQDVSVTEILETAGSMIKPEEQTKPETHKPEEFENP